MSPDWDTIYRECYVPLVRFLYQRTWDEERARDLAQEVFVRALRQSPEAPKAWLFAAAGNLARDEARTVIRRKRHLALLKTEAGSAAATETPETNLLRSEEQRSLRRALEALSERDRTVLLLWDSGLSYEDIGAAAGLATGAVGTTLVRARRRLLAAHNGTGVDDSRASQKEDEHATR